MLNFQSPQVLRNILKADAVTSLACGIVMCFGAAALSPVLGLPEVLLREAGLLLFPFAALVFWSATRERIPRPLVWIVVLSNALWAFDSILLLLSSWVAPTALGQAFVLAQAVAVALFAELEFFALRRTAQLAKSVNP